MDRGRRRARRSAFVLYLIAVASALAPLSALASSVTSAVFTGGTGTVSVSGTLYAKSGGALTLTVATSSDTKCVTVTGAFNTEQQSPTKQSTWIFNFTAGSGDGVQTVTAAAFPDFNDNRCNGMSKTPASASFTLDNTGPTVTASVSPAPNAAGWNNSNVTVTWTATDAGSGVGTGPNPPSTSQSGNTAGTTFTSTATDRLGNTGSGSVTVKVDKVAPSITGSRSPAPNANGWNNTTVTASFTCSDALSGIKSCSAPTTLTSDGFNQSVTGIAADNADNSSSTTVGSINIDKTAPALSGAPTTAPNGAGWYDTNVTIHWTCSDALSGIAGNCPSDNTISGEGTSLTASASVSDLAGNTTTAKSSPAVNIDKTAPVTVATAPSGWNNTGVSVSLAATDNLSGVQSTLYAIDGGVQTVYSGPFTIATEGNHAVAYWSVDKAGNLEAPKSVAVKIDGTPPTITDTHNPVPNSAGWNNTSVAITFNCSDALSGVASCTSLQTVTTQGASQSVTGTATDNAGNTASETTTVSIDETPPTISGSRAPTANTAGWNDTDVSVSFACSDALSGISSCPATTTVSSEGANQSVTRTARDAAGNTASATVGSISIDKTPPTLSGSATTAPNGAGWYSGDVVVQWACDDALSGIAGTCPASTTITGEGSNLGATATVFDNAGNSTTASVSGIKIDRTPPVTQASYVQPLPSGWYAGPVNVSLTATDNLAGIAATYFTLDAGAQQAYTGAITVGGGIHTLSFFSVDNAGNAETASSPLTFKVDNIAPTISGGRSPAANANGWNNGPVTVSFSCNDNETGVASCTASQTLAGEGSGQSATGTATDLAGNSSTASVSGINIDFTPPTVTGNATVPAGSFGWYDGDVTIHWSATDTLSGVDLSTVPADSVITGEGSNLGATSTLVSDLAGNTANGSISGINIDRTPPSIAGAPTASPNAAGWYGSPVTVHFSCGDALSGIATCPADALLASDGANQSANGTAVDKAGNSATTAVAGLNIDRTPPTTIANAPSGWSKADVPVTLSATDNLSGVAATYYTIDGAGAQNGTSFTVSGEGRHTVGYWSVDLAGNVEGAHTASVQIDMTAPTITDSQAPAVNANGWNNTDVTVTFTCSDPRLADGYPGSGVASCAGSATSPSTITVTTEGTTSLSETATDNAGNSNSDAATVRIDKTPPTLSGAPDRAANDNGWYKAPVTVHFACGDALSGIDSCPADVSLTADGSNQSASGTALDRAGNSASTTVSGINIDQAPPVITGATTASPNAAGWYNSPVTIHFTCSDALSGVAGCPAEVALSSDGENQSVTGTATDKAGNSASATVSGINIDRTPPATSSDAPTGWNNTSVPVLLSAMDNLSGVTATYYILDGGSQQSGGSLIVSGEGVHSLTYWSVDNAGNTEPHQTVNVRIDLTAPSITDTHSPLPNQAGWNNVAVTITFTCYDALSGVASCTAPQTLGTEGRGQVVTGTAIDNAGNKSTDLASVSIDKTPPAVSAGPDRPANAANWYNAPVTVTFTCGDTLSGVAFCPPATTLSTDGANQSVEGTAVDAAGNVASGGASGINVDGTAPSLSGAPASSPNLAGWYKDDVTIHWTCSDALSGIAGSCPPDNTISGEGRSLTTSASVRDVAGNTTSAMSPAVNIDRTPPVTIASAPSGWSNKPVTVLLTPSDSLSDVAATYYMIDNGSQQTGTSFTVSGEGTHTINFWSVDNAGNAELPHTFTVMIDLTPPAISHSQAPPANGNGWNNADVTITFSCADTLSGLATCTAMQTVTTEGAGQVVTGTALDNAGNSSVDSANVSIDKTPPTISGAPDRAANSNGWYSAPVTVHFMCGDALSGVANCSGPVTLSGDGANQSVSGTAADKAGNSASTTLRGINIDQTPPVITGAPTTRPNANGWYNGPVTIHFVCSDVLSGPATCPVDVVLSTDGANQSVTGTATDKAGNGASATVSGINIDRTVPTLTASPKSGSTFVLGTVLAPTCAAIDSLSGIASPCSGTLSGGQPNGVGTFTYTLTATDKAGNTATVTATYYVVYRVDGFLQPITSPTFTEGPDDSITTGGTLLAPATLGALTRASTFNAGRTVPVKFQLEKADGTIVPANSAPIWLQPVQLGAVNSPLVLGMPGTTPATVCSPSAPNLTPPCLFRSDAVARQYIYNWITPSALQGFYLEMGVQLDDGTIRYGYAALI